MPISYPHDYESGALNPWAGTLNIANRNAGSALGQSPSFLAAPFLLGVVLYAWKEMVIPDTFSESDPLNVREIEQETVFVCVRIPEIHNFPVPRGLPSNNDLSDHGADWDAINRYPAFQAADATIIAKPLPQPGEIVKVDFQNRPAQIGPIYLGLANENTSATPTPVSPSSPSTVFQKTAGNNAKLGTMKPTDLRSILYPTLHEGTLRHIIGSSPAPPGTDLPLIKPGLAFITKAYNERKRGKKSPAMPSGGKYPTGLRHPATNIVIHEPASHFYYGPKRIHRVLSNRGLGLHYSIAGANCSAKGSNLCDPGAKDIYQHLDPVTHSHYHGSPFNEISVGIELLRPTYQDKDPDGKSYFKIPSWWGSSTAPNKSLYLPVWNDFEPLFKLINYLVSHPGLHIPLQFPAVKIPGVNMNERDHTDAVPMSSYSYAFFQWGSPICDGLDLKAMKRKGHFGRVPTSPRGYKRQAPDTIVCRNSEIKYPQIDSKNTSNKGRGFWVPSDPVKYSRGIMAHARWHHSDGLPAEYYCLIRFMGYNAAEAYSLTKEAIRSFVNDTNITRLPPIKLN